MATLDESVTWSGLPAPLYWMIVKRREDGLMWLRLRGKRISVVEDVTVKADGRRWLHVSLAVQKPKNTLPSYEDINEVRRAFIGDHRECYHIFPPKERWVNFANVLHLWCCLDQPEGVLPRFEGVVEINGKETLSI